MKLPGSSRFFAVSVVFGIMVGAAPISVASADAGGCPQGLSPDMQQTLAAFGGGFDGCPPSASWGYGSDEINFLNHVASEGIHDIHGDQRSLLGVGWSVCSWIYQRGPGYAAATVRQQNSLLNDREVRTLVTYANSDLCPWAHGGQ